MKRFIVFYILFVSISLLADITLHPIFQNGMVIQRNQNISLWGQGSPGETVKIHTSWGENVNTTTNDTGKWDIKIRTPKAGGPYAITIQGNNKIVLKNILSGDVWLCSGQSNMYWKIKSSGIYTKEISESQNNEIRFFSVNRKASITPQTKLKGRWFKCTPGSMSRFSAVAYFFGKELNKKLKVPIGLITASWGGTYIGSWIPWDDQKHFPHISSKKQKMDEAAKSYNLSIEKNKYEARKKAWKEKYDKWKISKSKKRPPRKPRFICHPHISKQYPSSLYNGMIAPLCPFALKGVIWYQGEANAEKTYVNKYNEQLESLILSWRKNWQMNSLPFYFVQLPNYGPLTKKLIQDNGWSDIREAFLQVLNKVPNTGMAITIDIGEIRNIHPKNKYDIGKRLALLALKYTYKHDDAAYSGPIPKSIKISENSVRVKFDTGGGPLAVRNNAELKCFVLVDNNGKAYNGKAVIISKDTVLVSNSDIRNISMIYYAWAKDPIEANLINSAGLPASPFRAGRNELDKLNGISSVHSDNSNNSK